MSKSSVVANRALNIFVATAIYAAALEALEFAHCYQSKVSCTLGGDTTAREALLAGAILAGVAGLIAIAVASCVAVASARVAPIRLWFAVILGAVAGVVPLAVPCIWAKGGCVVANWAPFPAFMFAVAGVAAVVYLWWRWFRHLTTHSTGRNSNSADAQLGAGQ